MLLSLKGAIAFIVNCSINHLSFMTSALIKTIKLLMMSSFLPVGRRSFVC